MYSAATRKQMAIPFPNYLEFAFTKSLLFYFSVAPVQNAKKMNRAWLTYFY